MATATDDFEVQGTPDDQIAALTNQAPPAKEKTDASARSAAVAPTGDDARAGSESPGEPADDAAANPAHDRDEHGRFQRRHRARSQQAGPDDVPRIAALTKRLRETEASYEARIKALEERLTKPAETLKPPTPPAPAGAAATFDEAEPTIEQFADKPDPYAAWLRAVNAYDRKKEAFEARQKHQAAQRERATTQYGQQQTEWTNTVMAQHAQRHDAYMAAHPEHKAVLEQAADLPMTPTMVAAIALHAQGPELMLALAQNAALADELFLLTHGKPLGDPVSNPLVAIVQRRLLAKPAVPTGSAAPPKPAVLAPRPPNPVRTTPQAPADTLPGDDDSLEAHEKIWGPRRRRFR